MKALVCDCCGKVVLIPESCRDYGETGIHRLIADTLDYSVLDLCQECADKLMEAVRNVRE